jgi:peptidoglycan/LPS O-acetylase OafA/YrhL
MKNSSPFIVKAQDGHKGWLVAMHLTLTQGWFTAHYTAGWNTPAWSLSCEMFFYLIFPVLIIPMNCASSKGEMSAHCSRASFSSSIPPAGLGDQSWQEKRQQCLVSTRRIAAPSLIALLHKAPILKHHQP